MLFRNLCRERCFPWQLKISYGLYSDGIGKWENWNPHNDENENKENKSVDEFHEFILQQNPANTVSLSLNKNTKWH